MKRWSAKSIIGERFDRLVIMRQAFTVTEARWWARCDCGGIFIIAGPELRRKAKAGKLNACEACLKDARRRQTKVA